MPRSSQPTDPASWLDILAASLAAGTTCVLAAGGLAAVLARQVVERGRYPVFESSEAPSGFLLEWARAAVGAAWPGALVLSVLVLLVGAMLRRRILGRSRRVASYVVAVFLGVLWVAGGASWLREQVEDDRPAADFLPPAVVYSPEASDAELESESAEAVDRPDIVLFTIDTLRADHLGFMGYERDTSPNLDGLAERGVAFRAAIAPAPMTQHSVAAMMTGQPPHAILPPGYGPGFRGTYLREGFDLLAERLQEAGYLTAGFVANPRLKATNGFAQGFETYDDSSGMYGPSDAGRRRDAGHIVDAALAWLERTSDDPRPRFLWLHVLDPHQPYEPERPGPWEDVDSQTFQDFETEYRSWSVHAISEHLRAMRDGEKPVRPGEVEYLVGRYDAEILQADRHLGRFWERWAEMGRDPDRTLLLVTSDHGEEFYDHGGFLHAHTLFDELIHVPLVITGPGFDALGASGGRQVAGQVSLLDVAPTLLEAAGLPTENWAQSLAGRPLQRTAKSRDADGAASVAAAFLSDRRIAFRSSQRKLISRRAIIEPGCPSGEPRQDMVRLFRARYVDRKHWPKQRVDATVRDLVGDPRENRVLDDPWEVHRMLCSFGNYLRAHPALEVEDSDGGGLSEEDRESLRALGYVVD